jgi:hypothetical protein
MWRETYIIRSSADNCSMLGVAHHLPGDQKCDNGQNSNDKMDETQHGRTDTNTKAESYA